jgi:hypothetical protein
MTNPDLNSFLYRFICNFHLTVVLRSKERGRIYDFLCYVRDHATEDQANWTLSVFCNEHVLKELLVDCSIVEARKFVTVLIDLSIAKAAEVYKVRLLFEMIRHLHEFVKPSVSKYYTQYCHVIYCLVRSLGSEFEAAEVVATKLLYHLLTKKHEAISVPELRPSEFTDADLGYAPDYNPPAVVEDRIIYYDTPIQSSNASMHHLVSAVSILTSKLAADDLALLTDSKTVKRIANMGVNKIATKAISALYLSTGDEAIIGVYLQTLLELINDKDYDDLKKYLRQFRAVVTTDCEHKS